VCGQRRRNIDTRKMEGSYQPVVSLTRNAQRYDSNIR
jgi:hypothetical protein